MTRRASKSVMESGSCVSPPFADVLSKPKGRSFTTYLLPVVACFATRTVPCVPLPMTLPKMRSAASVRFDAPARGLGLGADEFREGALLRSCACPPRGRFPGLESREDSLEVDMSCVRVGVSPLPSKGSIPKAFRTEKALTFSRDFVSIAFCPFASQCILVWMWYCCLRKVKQNWILPLRGSRHWGF